MATLSLLACGSLAWMAAARRDWSIQPAIVTRVASVLGLVAGVVWSLLLVPAWPGLLLMAGAAVAVVRAWPRPRRAEAVEPAVVDRALATTAYRPHP
jgi:hypothetical protein